MSGVIDRLRSLLGGSGGDESVESEIAVDHIESAREHARADAVDKLIDIPDVTDDIPVDRG